MTLPEAFLTRGLEIEIGGRTYTIVGRSMWLGLHVVPEFRREPGDNREPDIDTIRADDPRISVSYYQWNNRAKAVRFLESDRHQWAYPLLDGTGPLKPDQSRRAITEAMRRVCAGERPALGVLGPWGESSPTDPQYEWEKARKAAGTWDGSEWHREVMVGRWNRRIERPVRVLGQDNYWRRSRRSGHSPAWRADWTTGPAPDVEPVEPGRVAERLPAPSVTHRGDTSTSAEAMAAADSVLAPDWILL